MQAYALTLEIRGFFDSTEFFDNDEITSRDVRFTFETDETVSFVCSLERNGIGENNDPCGGSDTLGEQFYNGLSDGSYLFSVIAQPAGGSPVEGFFRFVVGDVSLGDVSSRSSDAFFGDAPSLADAGASPLLNPPWDACEAGTPQRLSTAEYKIFGSAKFRDLFRTDSTNELSVNIKVDYTDNSVSGELEHGNDEIKYNIDKVDTRCKFATPPSATATAGAVKNTAAVQNIFTQSNPPFHKCAAPTVSSSYSIDSRFDYSKVNSIISDLDAKQDVDIVITQNFEKGVYSGELTLDDDSSNENQIDLSLTGSDIQTECNHKIKVS